MMFWWYRSPRREAVPPQMSCGRTAENYSGCWADGAMVGYVICRVNSKEYARPAKCTQVRPSLTRAHRSLELNALAGDGGEPLSARGGGRAMEERVQAAITD